MSGSHASIRSASTSSRRVGPKFCEFVTSEKGIMTRRIVLFSFGLSYFCFIATAQNATAPAKSVQLKRTPPTAKPATQPGVQNYDFAGQLRTLENGDTSGATVGEANVGAAPDLKEVPKDFRVRTDIP